MPQVTIPDDTYDRLARRAAALNVTVKQLVAPALERVAEAETVRARPVPALRHDQWKARFDEVLATVQSRADRYPPGFQADVRRESLSEGCGE